MIERPVLHFTPDKNWMNDPNGLVFHDGEYHLFYQYNPYGRSWGHMSWGHAVSSDLMNWELLPIAILEEPDAGYTIFSGSAVVDYENTSGLGGKDRPAMVAVYTACHHGDRKIQDIHIAYSLDRGRTFTKHPDNPRIDLQQPKFGDPKVFWHDETRRWVMVNIFGKAQGCIALYGSDNLIDWSPLSWFEGPKDAPGMWECPDLFALPIDGDPQTTKWIMKANHPVPTGGRTTRYWVGDFDGTVFKTEAALPYTQGSKDPYYAEVTYNGIPDKRVIQFGWIQQGPAEDRAWTGAQSIPRELKLVRDGEGFALRQIPAKEAEDAFGAKRELQDVTTCGRTAIPTGELPPCFRFDTDVSAIGQGAFGLVLDVDGGSELRVCYSRADAEMQINRDGERERSVAIEIKDGEPAPMSLIVDHGIIEAFMADGRAVASLLIEPFQGVTSVHAESQGAERTFRNLSLSL